jgi:hypothetical protein
MAKQAVGVPKDIDDSHVFDEFEPGSLLLIEKAFDRNGTRWYSYAAVKSGQFWYVTGNTRDKGMSTAMFIQWLLSGSRLCPTPRVYWAKTVYEI